MDSIRHGLISHAKANVCDVIFTAGQSIRVGRTCGSIITCVIDGQSRYDKVVKFFSHICGNIGGLYAYVEWFNKTDYPFKDTPLVVRVRDNSQPLGDAVVSIFDIDPSRVILERSDRESCYYMCRIEGIDTVKPCPSTTL